MAQESGETNRLLREILLAIQSLDENLKTQDRRIGDLEIATSQGKDIQASYSPRIESTQNLPLESVTAPILNLAHHLVS